MLLRGLENPQAYAVDGLLYVAQQVTPLGSTVLSELMRVDPDTGQVLAVRRLKSTYDQALLTKRTLWVTTTKGNRLWLWRVDPRTLTVRSRQVLPGSGDDFGFEGAFALAGGWLWIGSWDHLDRVSLASGQLTGQISIPHGQGVDVAADPSGHLLVDSEGHGAARVQRRDPVTGALMASSQIFQGVDKPYIGGIDHDTAWISEATGNAGYAQALDVNHLATAQPTNADKLAGPGKLTPPLNASNGIEATVISGVLWITQPAGGAQRNYCGDPTTGRSRAALALPAAASFLTADATSIYYIPDTSGARVQLARAPINPRCRS